MAEHNELGKKGEEVAQKHLVDNGYVIRDLNWRYKRNEIDIIAEKNNLLVVVEVKSRRDDHFESPKDAVTITKQRFIINATEAYINEHNIESETRFDVISVIFEGNEPKIEHIEDAFQPNLL